MKAIVDHWTRRLLALMVAGMILAPAAAVWLEGRDLAKLNDFRDFDDGALGARLLWLASLLAVAGAASILYLRPLRWRSLDRTSSAVLVGFGVFYTTNVLMCAALGTEPWFARSLLYSPILALAVIATRDDGASTLIGAVRTALTVMMLASFAYAFKDPAGALRFYAPENRLPFVGFRFWGLGAGPNSIGPLALILLLVTLHEPFRSRLWTGIALASGVAVLVLAQSQTTWFATALIFGGGL